MGVFHNFTQYGDKVLQYTTYQFRYILISWSKKNEKLPRSKSNKFDNNE